MPEKTPGKARKSTSRKKTDSPKTATVTPISQRGLPAEGNSTAARNGEQGTSTLILEQIRIRAYELFEQRGRLDGFDQEDWTRAEVEVRARFQREKSA
jgi:hypothetical protein